jgi:hypothetical protein
MSMTARTIEADSLLVATSRTKPRSILSAGQRQAREVRKARVAGAEIVHRDLEPRLAQAREQTHGLLGLVHQAALRDLELDQARRHLRGRENAADQRVEDRGA